MDSKERFIIYIFADQCVATDEGVKGKLCQFPFKYNGEMKNGCIKDGKHVFWCATETDDEGNPKEKVTCSDNCPIDCGK